jgi:hypothetical protein
MSVIWLTVKEFLTSKKFIVAVAGVLIATAGKYGLNLDADSVQNIVYVVVAYLIGQGWADSGKEAAKVAGTVELATTDGVPTGDADHPDKLPQAVKDKLV